MHRLFAALLALPLLAACGKAPPPAAAGDGPELEAGRAVYNYRCYFCHGYSGDARTLAATYLTPPPADFTRASPETLTPERILDVLRRGKPGTAMKPFTGIIGERDMRAVAAFVYDEFVLRRRPNTRYHTAENGWPDHERYRAAFPFARGEIALTQPWEELTPEQARGKRLYLQSCVSCHDRGRPAEDGVAWDSRPLSFPRNQYDHAAPPVDALTHASPYARHDIVPRIAGLSALEKKGEALFQANCAFCHAADGTGKNWIGSFLEPHPRNLTDPQIMATMTRSRLKQAIREGLPETSMPAWKSVLSEEEIDAVIAYIARAFHPLTEEGAAQ
jgi:cytochrome c oxidase cbb3-type subunit 3